MRSLIVAALASLGALSGGCGSPRVDPFKPVPECEGAAVTPFQGSRQMLISSLLIADVGDGFDLDLDGKNDNILAALGALANSEIARAFAMRGSYDIAIPLELFGYDGAAQAACVKTAFYLGQITEDRDNDGRRTGTDGGDCLDSDPEVRPGKPEIMGNRLDDDCDGYADNMVKGARPADTDDRDGDGFSPAQGDCDDRDGANLALAKSRNPMAMDVCDDGIDQDCDGVPDNHPSCFPFGTNNVTIDVTDASFTSPGTPQITFKSGKIENNVLAAGPDLFRVSVPITDFPIDLELSGARLQMTLSDNPGAKTTKTDDGLLAGVLQATTLSQITGIEASDFIKKEQSLLDAVFVGPVGTVLGLDSDNQGHFFPDIDVDGDGYETFYNTNPPAAGQPIKVDTCVDGDGTVIMSTPTEPCALAKDADGKPRFVDGLSVSLRFTAVPVKLSGQIVPQP
jgi:hypothetical protein